MDYMEQSLKKHYEWAGKIDYAAKMPIRSREDLSLAYHDDQHGTAVVTLAAVLNALRVVGKRLEEVRLVTLGAGAAGLAVVKLLMKAGLKDAVLCDRKGVIHSERFDLNEAKAEMAALTNREGLKGSLAEALEGADIFIGLSSPGTVTEEMVRAMAEKPILFPMANPIPEIMPEEAKRAGAAVIGTGRSDFDNQINNVLAFPGIFRGALDVRASDINDEMKLAAAYALAGLVPEQALCAERILPEAFDEGVAPAVAAAVARAARESGLARI